MAIFNPDRYGFCILGGKVIVMDVDRRSMQTQVWMEDVLRLSKDDIDLTPRGYFAPGRIQFFVGPNYHTCPDVDVDMVADAVAVYAGLYGVPNTTAVQMPVYNGVWPGTEGETWPPVLQWDYDIGRWEVTR